MQEEEKTCQITWKNFESEPTIILCDPEQSFSNFNVHYDLLVILLKWGFWFSRSGVGPEILHFYKLSGDAYVAVL